MKRVLVFSLAYYPQHVSGAEAAIKEITERIGDIEFHLITLHFNPADPSQEKLGNVQVHRVGSGSYLGKILFPLAAAWAGRELNARYRFDGAWAMMTYMLLPLMLARMLGVRVPYALTLQDGDPYEKVFGRLRILPFLPLVDRGFREATVIQVISKYLETWPKKRGSSAPVVLIRNGANPRDLKESFDSAAVEAIRQRIGKRPGETWLVNTARLEHQKGFDTTLQALTHLPHSVRFLIVGGGSEEGKLKTLARELNIEKRVFFTGQVSRDEVTAYRKAADIFVGPSRSEGLGNAFLSAMASRLPVVATQEGGLADFITPEVAWPVPKDDPHAIAQAVQDILADPHAVEAKTERARGMVLAHYDWDTVAEHMREEVFAAIT